MLHLHDNYGTRDDHSMPYFGTIDWDEIMRALRDIGYEGTFNYEVAATHLPMALARGSRALSGGTRPDAAWALTPRCM